MTFDKAFALMMEGKWVKCLPGMSTLYSIQDGTLHIKIPEYSKLGKQTYYIEKTLQPSDQCTLFVKHLISEEWEEVT
jgi:hypothetical protein